MSKFLDICKAYSDAIEDYEQYEKISQLFFQTLLKKFQTYFDIPADKLTVIPPSEGSAYFICLEEDLFWHGGFILTLFRDPNLYPHTPVKLPFRFKRERDKTFKIFFADVEKSFKIDMANDSTYFEFFDAIYESMMDSFKSNLDTILKSKTSQQIGF